MKKIPDQDLKFLKDDVPTPNEVVLLQEMERMTNLTNRIYSTLVDLKRAIKGEIGMSAALDELGNSLFNGFLPAAWAKLAPQTEKPLGSWMDHYTKRYLIICVVRVSAVISARGRLTIYAARKAAARRVRPRVQFF